MNRVPIALAAALAAFLAWAPPLQAQTSTVTGRVTDAQGAVVSGANVTLMPAGAQRGRETRSSSDGTFSFTGVTAGDYLVLVQTPGFGPLSQAVTVAVVGAAPLELSLQVAGVAENVRVEGALQGTAATGKTTLPLRELPLTVHSVPSEVIAEQAVNDLVTALQNVPSVNPFTTYGVYEYYSFRGFLDSVQLLDGVRNEGNRVNTQLTNIDRIEVLKGPSSALYGGGALGATINLITCTSSIIGGR